MKADLVGCSSRNKKATTGKKRRKGVNLMTGWIIEIIKAMSLLSIAISLVRIRRAMERA
jgi:hypothetical protein